MPEFICKNVSIMSKFLNTKNLFIGLLLFMTALGKPALAEIRVPAEWEEQAAIWLQWPGRWEQHYEPAFAQMVATILRHENVHILVNSPGIRERARQHLIYQGGVSKEVADGGQSKQGFYITWHDIPNDSAWMRDNGPRYIVKDGEMRIQNWEFDAWGGGFGSDIPYAQDNKVPDSIGEYLNLPVDRIDIVHERGDLEFNGKDTVIVNWNVLNSAGRGNNYPNQKAAAGELKKHFGVSRVIFADGPIEGDRTGGHVDGMARFIDTNRVVVVNCTGQSYCQPGSPNDRVYDDLAQKLQTEGFEVIRMDLTTRINYRDQQFDANYMNWLVGNGFVIAVGFDHKQADNEARELLESWFPDRKVYLINMLDSWIAGGGVHCHTNDQPALSTIQSKAPF